MTCCDPTDGRVAGIGQCPRCGTTGTHLNRITLKALLTSEALLRGVPDSPRFCATESTDVVYFDRDAGVVTTEVDLAVPVHAKHPADGRVPVCYCFGYTPSTIEVEIAQSGSSAARATITREVQAGRCACEVRNPKGICCLGDVARVEQRLRGLVHAEG